VEIAWVAKECLTRLTRELNKMLEIETKLFTAYHQQTDRQTEWTNQKLEQYLRIYVNHRQNNWLEWLATTEFVFNNKVITVQGQLWERTKDEL